MLPIDALEFSFPPDCGTNSFFIAQDDEFPTFFLCIFYTYLSHKKVKFYEFGPTVLQRERFRLHGRAVYCHALRTSRLNYLHP